MYRYHTRMHTHTRNTHALRPTITTTTSTTVTRSPALPAVVLFDVADNTKTNTREKQTSKLMFCAEREHSAQDR